MVPAQRFPDHFIQHAMESIIQYLVEMTAHRDHELLNMSVASSLRAITEAEAVRVWECNSSHHGVLLRERVMIGADGTCTAPEGQAARWRAVTDFQDLYKGLEAGLQVITGKDPPCCLWLPVSVKGRVHTCFELHLCTPLPPASLDMIRGILLIYQNYQSLLNDSEHDTLTGLLNRKTFDDHFTKVLRADWSDPGYALQQPQACQRRASPETPLHDWLAIIDIDHFKQVNDHYGHLYGDEVLILIANLLRTSFRPDDRLFRFGGEEFVVLLRQVSSEDAHRIFERFRSNVEAQQFPQVGRVTVSTGYAHIDLQEAPVAIMGRADQALYHAKTHGRNRVCHYDQLLQRGEVQHESANDTAEFF